MCARGREVCMYTVPGCHRARTPGIWPELWLICKLTSTKVLAKHLQNSHDDGPAWWIWICPGPGCARQSNHGYGPGSVLLSLCRPGFAPKRSIFGLGCLRGQDRTAHRLAQISNPAVRSWRASHHLRCHPARPARQYSSCWVSDLVDSMRKCEYSISQSFLG